MDEATLRRFESLHPVIKTRWDALLRTIPATSPLTHPDLMIFMVDEILGRVTAALKAEAGGGGNPGRTERSFCPCGRNPLNSYFLMGEQALIETAAPALAGAITEVLRHYQAVAQAEIDGFCGVCVHRTRDDCPFNAASGR